MIFFGSETEQENQSDDVIIVFGPAQLFIMLLVTKNNLQNNLTLVLVKGSSDLLRGVKQKRERKRCYSYRYFVAG